MKFVPSEVSMQVYSDVLRGSIQQLLEHPEPVCRLAGQIAALEPHQLAPAKGRFLRHLHEATVWRPDTIQDEASAGYVPVPSEVVRQMTLGRHPGDLSVETTFQGVLDEQLIKLRLSYTPYQGARFYQPENRRPLGNDLPDLASEMRTSRHIIQLIQDGTFVPQPPQ